jgi:AraC-like DNA-binding protein
MMRFQSALQEKAFSAPATIRSRYGINQTAVPVKLGDRLIGHLHTGQVFFRPPAAAQTRNALRAVRKLGLRVTTSEILRAYKGTRVLERRVYDGIIGMLEFFALHIASMANHLLLHETETAPVQIMRARQFIAEHYDEELRLSNLAHHLGVSPFVLCKQFRRTTGVTFKDYVSRLRVEKAKSLLLNPKYRVSEAAYAAGFQSLSNFNRHFRRITGQSPTRFRRRLKQLNAIR